MKFNLWPVLLLTLCIKNVNASKIENIVLDPKAPFEQSEKYFANRSLSFSPPSDGNLYEILIENSRDERGEPSFKISLDTVDTEGFAKRLADKKATQKDQSSQDIKEGSLHYRRTNLALFDADGTGTCSLIFGGETNLIDILVHPKSKAQGSAEKLSLEFDKGKLFIKLTPLDPKKPFWFSCRGTLETTDITLADPHLEQNVDEKYKAREPGCSLKSLLFRGKPFRIIGAGLEICCAAD